MARVPGLITKVLGAIWVIRPKALGHEMRIREKESGVMFGTETISEFECDAARRTFLLRPRSHAEGQPPAHGGDAGVWCLVG